MLLRTILAPEVGPYAEGLLLPGGRRYSNIRDRSKLNQTLHRNLTSTATQSTSAACTLAVLM